MKRTSFALLLAAAGCNWAYGLDATRLPDPPPDAAKGPVSSLTWAIATGTPPLELTYAAIGSDALASAKPMIQVGPALTAEGSLEMVDYPGELDGIAGGFEIPYPLRESPHRIVYQLPGDPVPYEVQWAVFGAHLTVPRTTRLNAAAPPPNGGYTIEPAGLSMAPQYMRMWSSGSLALIDFGDNWMYPTTSRITIEDWASQAAPLRGPLGLPDPQQGDWLLFSRFGVIPNTTHLGILGWAKTAITMLPIGVSAPPTEPTWNTTTHTMSSTTAADPYPTVDKAGTETRLRTVIGETGAKIVSNTTTFAVRASYGVSASTKLPGMLELPYENHTPPNFPSPNHLGFLYTADEIPSTVTLADPRSALGLPPVVFTCIYGERMTNGVTLASGVSSLTDKMAGQAPFAATFATNMKLGTTNLWGATDSVAHPRSTAPTTLSWSREAGYGADDYLVYLYWIDNNAMQPIRVYQVLTESVDIDSMLLEPGKTYVFRVDARVGFPNAASGDYREASYPFSVTTTYGRTFTVGT